MGWTLDQVRALAVEEYDVLVEELNRESDREGDE